MNETFPNETAENPAQTVERLTRHAIAPSAVRHRGQELLVLPVGCEALDLERLLDAPRRIRTTVEFTEFVSFLAYVNRFKDDDSLVFYDATSGNFDARLDWHSPEEGPSWVTHEARFKATKTPEWQAWIGSNNSAKSQADFAQFIEDNIAEVLDPAGPIMLEIASTFEAKATVAFSQAIRLQDGQVQLQYVEDNQAQSKGAVVLPEFFTIGVAPFFGGPAYRIRARLRHRIKEQRLSMYYRLDRPHLSLLDAVKDMAKLCAEETGLTPLAGAVTATQDNQ